MRGQIVRIENQKEGLVIRSATQEDAVILTNWWNDGKVMAHAGFPNGLNQSIEETKEQIKQNDTRLSQRCIIEANNHRIGELSFGIGANDAEIGIKICEPDYQNRGIGTKLLQMLIEFLFEDERINAKVHIHKIVLDTNLNNTRAQHVYEKLGFTKVNVCYDVWKDQLGTMQSSVEYELTRGQYEEGVSWITDADIKEGIATKVLADLPEWFGLPDSTREYINKSREMPFFAYKKDGQYVGFIVLKENSKYTAEIYVMGVLKEYHRKKVGKRLVESMMNYARNCNFEFIQVKTVDEGHYEEYDQTRLFYERIGFKKFETFPTLWDEWNPCLVMIQSVKHN